MIIYDLNRFSKVRIWFEGHNEFFFEKYTKTKLYEFNCGKSQLNEDRTIIIELLIPAGGRVFYGLLGIHYKYDLSQKISLKVNMTNKKFGILNDSLLGKIEDVYIGLPEEYLEGVYKGIEQAHQDNRLNITGEINFCYAAYGLISSCNFIFQRLSYALINLLFIDKEIINKEKLIEIFDKVIIN